MWWHAISRRRTSTWIRLRKITDWVCHRGQSVLSLKTHQYVHVSRHQSIKGVRTKQGQSKQIARWVWRSCQPASAVPPPPRPHPAPWSRDFPLLSHPRRWPPGHGGPWRAHGPAVPRCKPGLCHRNLEATQHDQGEPGHRLLHWSVSVHWFLWGWKRSSNEYYPGRPA